jgi:hypothetical protein
VKLPDTIYHLAEASNWPSIQRLGLLPASELIRQALPAPDARWRKEQAQRLAHTRLPSGVYLRDQRPTPPAALDACLIGLAPVDWYAMLNARVFFWLDVDRLNHQRAACRSREQVVLAVDAEALLAT